MLNSFLSFLVNKEIVCYNKHRQTIPIVRDQTNRSRFVFINIAPIWGLIPIKATNKLKYGVMNLFFEILQPKYLLDINWINRRQAFYKLWTQKKKDSKFIVVQHGSYIGGVVTDHAHRYTNCDIFLTWGDYFSNIFQEYNSLKKTRILSFGNSVYNLHDRSSFTYSQKRNHRILFAPSAMNFERGKKFNELIKRLLEFGFEVSIKEHNQQLEKFIDRKGITIEENNIVLILKSQSYDLVLTDHSSVLLDAIHFKNPVLFISPPDSTFSAYNKNNFSENLSNSYETIQSLGRKEDLYHLLNIENQEKLYSDMVKPGNNVIKEL